MVASCCPLSCWHKIPDSAFADWDKAIELDPKHELFYESRGLCKLHKGRYDEAIADFGQGLQLVPGDPRWYLDRGWAKLCKGEYDEAVADYDQAIAIQLKKNQGVVGYDRRGIAKQLKGDFDGAIVDFDKASQWAPSSLEPQILLWLVLAGRGQTAAASQELSSYLDRERQDSKPPDGLHKIASFLLDKIAEADFLATVPSSSGGNCEFCYYAGMKHLLTGDKKKAGEYFRKCLATELFDRDEYQLAKAELKALGSN